MTKSRITKSRITLVISSLGRGGAERVMCFLANRWAEHGQSVTLITFDHTTSSTYPLHTAVNLRSLGLLAVSKSFFHGLFRNLKRIRALRRAVRESQPGLVISFMDSTNVLTLLATRGLGVPVIVSERTVPSQVELGVWWNGLRRLSYGFADAVVCQTRWVLRELSTLLQIKAYVIPNPIAIPSCPKRHDTSSQHNGCSPIVIAMGRLAPEKGFDLLLTAFARISKQHPSWSLTIAGEGPLRSDLEKQAMILGINGKVRFVGWVADPFSALASADLFVLSSRFEGFPNVLCEAMASGLAAISFDCAFGPREIIRHGIDGILVPPQDEGALAAAMDHLMGDGGERKRLAAMAPGVLQRFGEDRILSLWQQLFDDLLAKRQGRRSERRRTNLSRGRTG